MTISVPKLNFIPAPISHHTKLYRLCDQISRTPLRSIEEIVTDLFTAANKLHAAYAEYRRVLSAIAGCDLAEWDYETLEKYGEGLLCH